jgi:hypothetical protein
MRLTRAQLLEKLNLTRLLKNLVVGTFPSVAGQKKARAKGPGGQPHLHAGNMNVTHDFAAHHPKNTFFMAERTS